MKNCLKLLRNLSDDVNDTEEILHIHPDLIKGVCNINIPDYSKYDEPDNEKEFILHYNMQFKKIYSSDTNKISNDRLQRFVGVEAKTSINIILDSYYRIYEEGWYIGRVIEKLEGKWRIKFFKRLSDFRWPARDDIQEVCADFILFGPLKLLRNHPFNISKQSEEAIPKSYKRMKKLLYD